MLYDVNADWTTVEAICWEHPTEVGRQWERKKQISSKRRALAINGEQILRNKAVTKRIAVTSKTEGPGY